MKFLSVIAISLFVAGAAFADQSSVECSNADKSLHFSGQSHSIGSNDYYSWSLTVKGQTETGGAYNSLPFTISDYQWDGKARVEGYANVRTFTEKFSGSVGSGASVVTFSETVTCNESYTFTYTLQDGGGPQ